MPDLRKKHAETRNGIPVVSAGVTAIDTDDLLALLNNAKGDPEFAALHAKMVASPLPRDVRLPTEFYERIKAAATKKPAKQKATEE